jgi:hypothetical protein
MIPFHKDGRTARLIPMALPLLLLVISMACGTLPAAESTTPLPQPSAEPIQTDQLSVEQLMNAEYLSEYTDSGRAKLENGTLVEEILPGSAEKLMVSFTGQYASGDLDNDGDQDAAVILATETGGSGLFISLEAVLNDGGQPQAVATLFLGDRVRINAITLQEGKVNLDMLVHATEDPFCCPSQAATRIFHLEGNAWVEETP